jgi:hypothetical protein
MGKEKGAFASYKEHIDIRLYAGGKVVRIPWTEVDGYRLDQRRGSILNKEDEHCATIIKKLIEDSLRELITTMALACQFVIEQSEPLTVGGELEESFTRFLSTFVDIGGK